MSNIEEAPKTSPEVKNENKEEKNIDQELGLNHNENLPEQDLNSSIIETVTSSIKSNTSQEFCVKDAESNSDLFLSDTDELNDDERVLLYEKATSFLRLKNLNHALLCFLGCLKGLKPTSKSKFTMLPQCLTHISEIYAQAEDFQKAVEFMQAAKLYYETAIIETGIQVDTYKKVSESEFQPLDLDPLLDEAKRANEYERLSNSCLEQRKFQLALEYCGKATKLRQKVYGDEHSLTVKSLDLFTLIYAEMGKSQYSDAMLKYGDSLKQENKINKSKQKVSLAQDVKETKECQENEEIAELEEKSTPDKLIKHTTSSTPEIPLDEKEPITGNIEGSIDQVLHKKKVRFSPDVKDNEVTEMNSADSTAAVPVKNIMDTTAVTSTTEVPTEEAMDSAVEPSAMLSLKEIDQNGDTELHEEDVMDPTANGGDTDTEISEEISHSKKKKLFRLSSRISSLKRRGRFLEPKEVKPEFDFYADDDVTVRGPKKSFWVCRILEDVLETDDRINIAWYDSVGDNKYKVSFDDVIFKSSILMHVPLIEDQNTMLYSLPNKYITETMRLLKRSLCNDQSDVVLPLSDREDSEEEEMLVVNKKRKIFDFPSEDEETCEPASKRKKTKAKKAQKVAGSRKVIAKNPKSKQTIKKTSLREKKVAVAVKGSKRGLIPNPGIKILTHDPTFEVKNKIPLMTVKKGIKAVFLKDTKLLEDLLKDKKNVYTINWTRSPHNQYGPHHYAIINENRKALQILDKYKSRTDVKAKKPTVTLLKKDTGSYNHFTFGHAVREVTTSRGNKEGNNAFLLNDDELDYSNHVIKTKMFNLALKKNLSYEFICWYFQKLHDIKDYTIFEQYLYIPIQYGHNELAGEFMKKAVAADGFGYNFLHQETLCNTTQKLSKFKTTSVTKKPFTRKTIYPLHCACINPNVAYAKELFAAVPEYNIADFNHWLPVHYAAVCSGDGPLKFLLSRGVDANIGNNMLCTPLMLAAKCGRLHNIKVLMEATIDVETDDGKMEKQKVVKINAKNKKSLTALHIAARKGHADCVQTLIDNGALIDLQASASKDNLTALCFATTKGHYDVVKVLIQAGAAPDKKTRRSKTALMYACMNGHSMIVAYLLRTGVDPNAVDSSDNTSIHYAAAYGWYHCVQLLLEGGANPNVPNNWKTTPLYVALSKGHVEIADLLLSADVDVNHQDEEGKTILMNQLENGFTIETLNLVKYLIEKKHADVNIKDVKEQTALHLVASTSVYQDRPISDTSFKFHSNSYQTFDKNLSDLCSKITNVIVAGGDGDLNSKDQTGATPLSIAVRETNVALVYQLLELGADPKVCLVTKTNESLLHVLLNSSYEHVTLHTIYPKLYSFKSVTDDAGIETVLRECSLKIMLELAEAFIKHGCEINKLDIHGSSPLMGCVHINKIFEILLQHGANPLVGETKDTNENILHKIAKSCAMDGVEIIAQMTEKFDFPVEFGNKVNCNGYTPLHLLLIRYQSVSIEDEDKFVNLFELFIEKFNCDISKSVGKMKPKEKVSNTVKVERMDIDESEGEEEEESDVEDVDKKENIEDINNSDHEEDILAKKYKDYNHHGLYNVLHFAVLKCADNNACHTPTLMKNILRRLGHNHELLSMFNRYGRTPLQSLIKTKVNVNNINFVDNMLQQLIDAGSNVVCLSNNGKDDVAAPPLIMLIRSSIYRHGILKLVKTFIKNSTDVNICDGVHGGTALSYAVQTPTDNPGLVIVSHLLKAGSNINTCDNYGRTPLHYAVNFNSGDYESLIEMENLLVENGARKDIVDKWGRLPLHYAFYDINNPESSNIADPISVLTMLCNVNEEDISLFGDENSSMATRMSKYINQADVSGKTPLHYASMKGATLACMYLEKLKADDKLVDVDGNTPLALALRGNHIGCAMNLLQNGSNADYDIVTPIKENALETYKKQLNKHEWTYNKRSPIYPIPTKDSVFQLTIRKNWQGLAYMMLEVANIPVLTAFKAGMIEHKLNLLWTLLKKQRNISELKSKDADGKTLLHLVAYYANSAYFKQVNDENFEVDKVNKEADDVDKEVNLDKEADVEIEESNEDHIAEKSHIEIVKLLLRSGFQLADTDCDGATPLHYAAAQNNFEMVEFFLKQAPQLINVKDKDGHTPLVKVIISCQHSISNKQVALIKYLVNNGAEVDLSFTLKSSNTTLINELVKLGNIGSFEDETQPKPKTMKCFDYFLKHNIDVNFVITGKPNALITSILLNDEDILNLLLKHDPDLEYADSANKNCIHHCVKTSDYASHENDYILRKLIKAGAPINGGTLYDQTALDIACTQKSGLMAKILTKHKAKTSDGSKSYTYKEVSDVFPFSNEYCKGVAVDVKAHSEKEIKQKVAEQNKDMKDVKLKPDPALDMDSNGELYYDPVTDVPYDTTLAKVDIRWGTYGMNLNYKLQVVYHKGKDLWILFNRWGRTGGNYQHQQTPYSKSEEATLEFKKIFKSKTGNDWSNVENFVNKPKKYALVSNETNPERVLKVQKSILHQFDLDASAKSHLPKPIQEFMKDISKKNEISDVSCAHLNSSYVPCELVKLENINKAKAILQKIKELVSKDELKNPENNQTNVDSFVKISEMSNQYFMLLPPRGYSYESFSPLNTTREIEKVESSIEVLTELNPIVKIMIAAQHRMKEVNPLDYCFKALNVRIEVLSSTCYESQLILKNIYSIYPNDSFDITGILRCERDDDTYMDSLPEKHLLWHGTKNAHTMSILLQGLQINPLHCNSTGLRFGTGLYFSWDFTKSLSYSDYNSNKYVLLYEVSSDGFCYPDNNQMRVSYDDDIMTSDVWLRCKTIPDPQHTVTTPYGANIFQGALVPDDPKNDKFYRANQNEVIIRSSNQAKLRYIVQMGSEYR